MHPSPFVSSLAVFCLPPPPRHNHDPSLCHGQIHGLFHAACHDHDLCHDHGLGLGLGHDRHDHGLCLDVHVLRVHVFFLFLSPSPVLFPYLGLCLFLGPCLVLSLFPCLCPSFPTFPLPFSCPLSEKHKTERRRTMRTNNSK